MVFLRDRRIRLELATGGKGGGVQTIWAGVRWIKVTTYFANIILLALLRSLGYLQVSEQVGMHIRGKKNVCN